MFGLNYSRMLGLKTTIAVPKSMLLGISFLGISLHRKDLIKCASKPVRWPWLVYGSCSRATSIELFWQNDKNWPLTVELLPTCCTRRRVVWIQNLWHWNICLMDISSYNFMFNIFLWIAFRSECFGNHRRITLMYTEFCWSYAWKPEHWKVNEEKIVCFYKK